MDAPPGGFLVFLDGSATSERALDVALTRAEKTGAAVTLLAIVPPTLWRAKQGQFQVSPVDHDDEFARSLIADAKAACAERGVTVFDVMRSGPPAQIIVEEAAKGYEVVVIGERRNLVGAPTLVSIVKDRLPTALEIVEESA
ncbi:MAG: universal stress protein [Actinomycetota bacterium]|nr:universal stress protein [Actinomycetota bacterium]